MNKIEELHAEAMNYAETAFMNRIEGSVEKAAFYLRLAYESEAGAARSAACGPEPTRSILFRSAASLAISCDEIRQAEKLIAEALAGDPPEEIAEELRDLLERVNFERHLNLRGVSLANDEIQISIAGKGISPGMAPADEFTARMDRARKLMIRTLERLKGKPYREGGGSSADVRGYELYVSTPRAASFAVSLRVSSQNRPFPGLERDFEFVEPGAIIDEIMACLQDFKSCDDSLRRRIPEEAYYRNFVGIARSLSPDGEQVRLVGFTAIREGQQRRVELTEPRGTLRMKSEEGKGAGPGAELQTIAGILKFADEISKSRIKLVDKDGGTHDIIVPTGMMSDIVRPLWGEWVSVTGYWDPNRKALRLVDVVKDPQR